MFPRKISKEAKQVMDALYENFNRTGEWIGIKTLRVEMGSAVIDRLFRKYEPALFKQFPTHQNRHCELTFYGFLRCEKAREDVEQIYKLLELARDSYLDDPERRQISVKEIRDAMKLSQDKSDRLKKLVSIFCHRNSFSITATDWHFDIPEDIEKLSNGISTHDYILKWVEFCYKSELRYYQTNRWQKVDKIKVGFWILVITQAWTMSLIFRSIFSASFSYLVFGFTWLTFYSFVKILQLFEIQHPLISHQKFVEKLVWYFLQLLISLLAVFIAKKMIY